jgi:hypothetical protein
VTVYLFCDAEAQEVMLMAPADSPDGRVKGNMLEFVRPGGEFLGHSYEELRALGNGRHDLALPAERVSQPEAP